jgi:hypothetical protein
MAAATTCRATVTTLPLLSAAAVGVAEIEARAEVAATPLEG